MFQKDGHNTITKWEFAEWEFLDVSAAILTEKKKESQCSFWFCQG